MIYIDLSRLRYCASLLVLAFASSAECQEFYRFNEPVEANVKIGYVAQTAPNRDATEVRSFGLGVETFYGYQEGWYCVEIESDTCSAWVNAERMRGHNDLWPFPGTEVVEPPATHETTANVRVRLGPATIFDSSRTLPSGTQVRVSGRLAGWCQLVPREASSRFKWSHWAHCNYLVQPGGASAAPTAWSASEESLFYAIEPRTYVTLSKAKTTYAKRSTESAVVERFPFGKRLRLLGFRSGWYCVRAREASCTVWMESSGLPLRRNRGLLRGQHFSPYPGESVRRSSGIAKSTFGSHSKGDSSPVTFTKGEEIQIYGQLGNWCRVHGNQAVWADCSLIATVAVQSAAAPPWLELPLVEGLVDYGYNARPFRAMFFLFWWHFGPPIILTGVSWFFLGKLELRDNALVAFVAISALWFGWFPFLYASTTAWFAFSIGALLVALSPVALYPVTLGYLRKRRALQDTASEITMTDDEKPQDDTLTEIVRPEPAKIQRIESPPDIAISPEKPSRMLFLNKLSTKRVKSVTELFDAQSKMIRAGIDTERAVDEAREYRGTLDHDKKTRERARTIEMMKQQDEIAELNLELKRKTQALDALTKPAKKRASTRETRRDFVQRVMNETVEDIVFLDELEAAGARKVEEGMEASGFKRGTPEWDEELDYRLSVLRGVRERFHMEE